MTRDHLPRRPSPRRSAQVMTRPKPEGGPQPLESLVASARRLKGRNVSRSTAARWQDEAWAMYDEVGELRFVANALASASSKARVFAATVEPGDADPQAIHADEPDLEADERPTADDLFASETVAALARNVLGRAEMIRRVVLHLFVPGDGYLVGLPPGILDLAGPEDEPPEPGEQIGPEGGPELSDLSWHSLSVSEVRLSNGKVRLNIGDGAPVDVDEDRCVVVRVWRPHPRRWWEADSPVRSNLSVLRELVGLTKHVGATIDSRLAGAGLLIIGQSVEVVGAAHDPETGTEKPPADFVDALLDAMATAIEDRDSAAAIVPLTIKVPDDVVDKVRHISFATPFDEHAKELRDEAIRRLALGLDAPPEVLLGLGATNHWSAWQIDEATAKIHIDPVLALLCDALTTQYLWPALKEAGVKEPKRYVVWFDSSDLTMRPNRTAEATEGVRMGLVSDEAWRREAGFDENDAPEQPDVDAAVQTALAMVEQAPSLVADPGLLELVRQIREVLGGESSAPISPEDPPADPPDSGTDLPDTRDTPPTFSQTNGHRTPTGARR